MKQYNNIEQGSDAWHHIRKGKITGTTLKAIMGTAKAREGAYYEIIAERLTVGVEDETSYENPMDRGTRLEPEAVAMFEFLTGKETQVVGFCEHDDNEFIANSPDRLIGETQALEIKCPLGKAYVKAWLTNKVPEEYEEQTIQYFVLNDKLETLYFALYNPNIPVHKMHIIELHRKDLGLKIADALKAQVAFLSEVNATLETIIKI